MIELPMGASLALTFLFSWFGSDFCGSVWDSSKEKGGLARFMVLFSATLSISGFTWCYFFPLSWALPKGIFLEIPLSSFEGLGPFAFYLSCAGLLLALFIRLWRFVAVVRQSKQANFRKHVIPGWNTLGDPRFHEDHPTHLASYWQWLILTIPAFFLFGIVALSACGGLLTTVLLVGRRRLAVNRAEDKLRSQIRF